ncbi:hypothetical protein M885DRAFT_179668 [Pelagophyceae sp. CCMP2097]|nr:hypothetical protein M885DRAFT_179668 [Pelagophyceae sp. CCMP2097]
MRLELHFMKGRISMHSADISTQTVLGPIFQATRCRRRLPRQTRPGAIPVGPENGPPRLVEFRAVGLVENGFEFLEPSKGAVLRLGSGPSAFLERGRPLSEQGRIRACLKRPWGLFPTLGTVARQFPKGALEAGPSASVLRRLQGESGPPHDRPSDCPLVARLPTLNNTLPKGPTI